MDVRVTHKGKARVVRDVEPLVAVDRDGVCTLHPLGEMPRQRRDRGEQAEGTVNVQPRVVLTGQRGHVVQRVEITGVDVACGPDKDCGFAVKGAKRSSKSRYVETSRRVTAQDLCLLAPDAEHAKRFDHTGV